MNWICVFEIGRFDQIIDKIQQFRVLSEFSIFNSCPSSLNSHRESRVCGGSFYHRHLSEIIIRKFRRGYSEDLDIGDQCCKS